MTEPSRDEIKSYYDERVEGKLGDFTRFNPRIEAAIETLAEWAPPKPRRVLEIGCGIGATAWRMARAWPDAEVIGIDLSPLSIEVAKTCFQRPNLSYRAGLLAETVGDGEFDLVVLMDVYEHIAPEDRAELLAYVSSLLSGNSRVVMTFPTPHMQEYLRVHLPAAIQPVDENIGLDEIRAAARGTNTELIFYRVVGIWRYGDYAHAVLGRSEFLGTVAAREYVSTGLAGLKRRLKIWSRGSRQTMERNYLGYDIGVRTGESKIRLFDVPRKERSRCAASWARSR